MLSTFSLRDNDTDNAQWVPKSLQKICQNAYNSVPMCTGLVRVHHKQAYEDGSLKTYWFVNFKEESLKKNFSGTWCPVLKSVRVDLYRQFRP